MSKPKKTLTHILWAVFWVAVGIVWIMANRGLIHVNFSWGRDWPVIFIIIGISMFFNLITGSLKVKKKCSVTFNSIDKKNKTGKAKWLKIRVYDNNDVNPKVKVTIPISVIKSAIKIGGKFNVSIPEKAKDKMSEKGIDFNTDLFENIDELFDELAVNGRYNIVDVVDEDEGEKVEIYVE